MNAPHSLVKTVEAALTKEMVTLAPVLMDMTDLTVKMVILQYRFKFVTDVRAYP